MKLKLLKTSSLIVVKSLDVPPEHTHLHPARFLDTSKRQKSCMVKVFLSFLNLAVPKFKVKPVSPDCRVKADWLKCAKPQMSVTLSASQHPLSHLIPTPKAGIHRVNRMDVDLPMQNFIKKICTSFK
jgi:hypothetical protein